MGYCYDMRGRLACDACGDCGTTRKRTCPHLVHYPEGGSLPYCAAPALCAHCYAKHKHLLHQDCKDGAALATKRYRDEYDRVQAGDAQVKTAWGDWHADVPPGFVGVMFQGKDDAAIYHLIPSTEYGAKAGRFGGFLSEYATVVQPWQGPKEVA